MAETLDDIRADIAARLDEAATNRRSAMHTPCVVSGDVDARIMVLRGFEPGDWTLRFHTDARSPKVSVFEADPRTALLFYDREAKVQIRARGTARIVRDGELADNAWGRSTNFARRCYLGDAPGTRSPAPTSGLPPEFEGVEPSDAQVAGARANFALVLVSLDALDWFHLAHSGHRRAAFEKDRDGAWHGQWIAP